MGSSVTDDFRAFLLSLGLVPGPIVPGQKWTRCATANHPKKRNGSYRLTPDGLVGFAIDHAVHQEPVIWRAGKDADVPEFDVRKFREAQAAARQKLVDATNAARSYWEACQPLRKGHAYLEAHGLDMTGCAGLKVDRQGWLVAPMLRQGHLMSIQRISADGAKLFWPGASTAGTYYQVERPGATLNVICEGLATGLAIYAATPTARVRVCWSAGNLLPGSAGLPGGLTVIAADNDHATAQRIGKNPGIEAAEKAAAELGCGVAIPPCEDGESDYCDVRNRLLRQKRAARLPYETDTSIDRAVSAIIARALTSKAIFVARDAVQGIPVVKRKKGGAVA